VAFSGVSNRYFQTRDFLSNNQTIDIVCFLLHQLRSTPGPQDGIYHQRQVILRNTRSPLGVLWYLMKLAWYWRRQARRPTLRQVPFMVVALIHIASFLVLALLAANLIGTGNDVLVKSTNCGYQPVTSGDYAPAVRVKFQRSYQYVRECYDPSNATETSKDTCSSFPAKFLSSTIRNGAPCPFPDPNLCRNGTAGTFVIQTDPIDSHHHLGLNAPKKNRVSYRKITTCSPLPFSENPKYVEETPSNGTDFLWGNNVVLLKYVDPHPPLVAYNASGGPVLGTQPYFTT
jgi:hypothetical protein